MAETDQLLREESMDETISVCDSHLEPHFANHEIVRDVIIGLSDGLTVPFAFY